MCAQCSRKKGTIEVPGHGVSVCLSCYVEDRLSMEDQPEREPAEDSA